MRSRVDENVTWKGTNTAIDTETTADNNSNGSVSYMDGSDSSSEGATKYPFYVTLDSTDGLILGQHVFIEPDYGQTEVKEGIWLDESYIVQDDSDPYVWAANDRNKLEKRKVELGEYDDTLFKYEIVSGLTEEDYITWPMTGLYEGVTTVTDENEVDYSSPLYNMESTDTMDEDEFMEGGMNDTEQTADPEVAE